ncbi:GNAT family N-acetyltransferase [Chryseolinea lacunae]|uniref:GNAT family N-acetyltransferase n=1 Tax=Chryseolinea lacunae TaxID=2801331 RepID=A0ABS1KVI4_9BACT|nr:GNAT family N-acetyltransferase [Chryseolinea lacunae]MBL0743203.1 GNAT family N-acetyltransferase [Chryseolinea lacunae]
MTNAITIRTATAHDASLLASLGWKTFYETFAPLNHEPDVKMYVDKNFTTEQLTLELNDALSVFFIAELDGTAVGYAKLRMHPNKEAPPDTFSIELERIYSDSNYLGKNVGKTLLQTCLDFAKAKAYNTIWLGVWERNPRARAFYEKWGFEQYASHDFLLGTDLQTDLLYKKKIT